MRTRFVLGRGGSRGPSTRPKYLSQPPPTLSYTVGSMLKGNPFSILALEHEQCSFQHSLNSSTSVLPPESVVHGNQIPDSVDTSRVLKSCYESKISEPDSQITDNPDSCGKYTMIIRGRPKSHYFNTKVRQSKIFSKKLKESFSRFPNSAKSKSSLPTLSTVMESPHDTNRPQLLATSPDNEPNTHMDIDDINTHPTSTDSLMTPNAKLVSELGAPSNTFDEFAITPEEERELMNTDINSSAKKSSLQTRLTANTFQPDIKQYFSSKATTNIPTVPHVSPTAATNIGNYTSAPDPRTRSKAITTLHFHPTIPSQEVEHNKIPVKSNLTREITCRFKIRIVGGTCNLPLLVKQVVKLYRGVDSSLVILPIADPKNDSYIIDHEDLIPETEMELKQWVTSVVSHNDRVHFTMRFSISKPLSAISGPIFSWMKLNRSYVKMDTIKSEKISTLGFFEGFHPDFQTRDSFKKYCYDHIIHKASALTQFKMDDFAVYPRAVYVGNTVDKVTTRAMVIEVGENHSSSILNALSSAFSGMYSDVTFVPFTQISDDYKIILKMAMLKQNKLLHSLKRKQIRGLINPHAILKTKDGKETSLCTWLQTARDDSAPDVRLVQSVEETKYNTSSILYYEANAQSVYELCSNLKENMATHFPQSSIDIVFTDSYSPAPISLSRIVSNEETTWANIIKRKYLPNPQEDAHQTNSHSSPPSKFRKSVYYGTTKPPSPLREDTHVRSPQQSDIITVSSIQSDLSSKYQELENKFQAFMTSQEHINNETRVYVDNSIASMEENLHLQLKHNTDSIQTQISTLESTNSNQLSLLTQTLNNVAGNVNLLLSNFNTLKGASAASPASTITTAKSQAVGDGNH